MNPEPPAKYWHLPTHVEWAAIVRDLLAETPEVGTWAWACQQMLAEKKVRIQTWYRPGDYIEINGRGDVVDQDGDYYVSRVEHMTDTDWEVVPPPAPAIKRGDRVRWWRGEDSGTGTYVEPCAMITESRAHYIALGAMTIAVDRVEPLAGGAE